MAKRGIGIYYDEPTMRELMNGDKISAIEQDIIMQKLGEVQALFLQEFGFEGKFEVKKVTTSGGRGHRYRTSFRILATDPRTGRVLKQNPGWLGKFL